VKKFLRRIGAITSLAVVTAGAFWVGRQMASHADTSLWSLRRLIASDRRHLAGIELADGRFALQAVNVPPAEVFESVLEHVRHDYVRSYGTETSLGDGALSGMFASLNDPKTDFLKPSLGQAHTDALQGRFYGIGAVLNILQTKQKDVDYRYLTVTDVMPDSPAQKAGLQDGDRITHIDGHWIIAYSILADVNRIQDEAGKNDAAKQKELENVANKFKDGYSLSKAIELLTTGTGQTHQLTIVRPGEANPLTKTVTTALTVVPPVSYRSLGDGIGYLRILLFNQESEKAFQKALASAGSLKRLIVDLRQNPGGVEAINAPDLDGWHAAQTLIGELTGGGKAGIIEKHPNDRSPVMITASQKLPIQKITVLVDAGTANIAEFVAAALHDLAHAQIVGTHTDGDDVLQLYAPLPDGAAMEIATAHLLTATGADLSRGLTPDISLTPNQVDTDAAIQRAE
jgi:carboxyl-terminal processing protease